MTTWRTEPLEKLVEVDPEQLSNFTDKEYSFYYIDISSVSSGKITPSSFPITFKDSPSRARKILRDCDVLMSSVRPNLKAFAKFKSPNRKHVYIASTGFAVLRPKGNTDIDYIYHTLFSSSIHNQIESLVVGSNYPAINTREIRQLKITFPSSKTEQNRIAEILNTADEAITRTEALIAKYQRIKTGLMQDLLTRGIDEHGNIRSEATHRFVVKKGIKVPEEWEVVEINEILSKPLTYGIVQPGNNTPDGVFMVRSQDYTNGWNPLDTVMKVAKEIDKPYERSRVYETDLLITIVGANVGRMAIVPKQLSGSNISRSVARISINKTLGDSLFYYFLLRFGIEKLLSENTVGGAQPVLNLKELNLIKVVKPCILEQAEISKRISGVEKLIEDQKNSLIKIRSLKTGLMQDLLSGKVRVHIQEEIKEEI